MSRIEHVTPPAPGPNLRPRHERVGDIHVVRLSGSFYDMGRQHGEALRDVIPHGPLPYFRGYIDRLLGERLVGGLGPIVWPAFGQLVKRRVLPHVPAFARETMQGLADGVGVPLEELQAGAGMPDALLWLIGRVNGLLGDGPEARHRVRLGLGCTSALAWGGATKDGRLLHARNFDYHGIECWPRTKTLLFHEPDEGMPYVSVTAAGAAMGGITAMNEAGLTLAVHQHMFTDFAKLVGTPIGVAGDHVMRHAENLADAAAILRGYRPNGGWTYVVADGNARRVLCFEESPDRKASFETSDDDETFGYTNIYLDPELGAHETSIYGSYWRHNASRHQTVRRLLGERAGSIDADSMASILAHPAGPRERVSSAIGMLLTVGSVVFRPEDGVLWMATGAAPVCQRPFLPFSLAERGHAPAHGTLTGGAPSDPSRADAYDRFARAFVEYVDHGDLPAARHQIERARELDPGEPLYHALAGLFAVRDLDADHATAAFDRALEVGHPHEERVASFHLWRAHAHDLAGRRDRALADYRRCLGHVTDPPVYRAARRGLRRTYSRRRARRIDVECTFADVIDP